MRIKGIRRPFNTYNNLQEKKENLKKLSNKEKKETSFKEILEEMEDEYENK